MKKINLGLVLLLCILLVTGCKASTGKISQEEWKELDHNLNAQVMADGKLYFYTPYEVTEEIEKKSVIGRVKSVLGPYEIPSKDGQANFEIKGAKYAKYGENLAVLMDKKWFFFMNEEDWNIGGISIQGIDSIFETLGDDEGLKVTRRITFGVQMDDDYKNNIDAIIEEAFEYYGIDDPELLEDTKSNFTITISDE